MALLNDYGGPDPNVDESLGDVAYEALEQKAKEEAKELGKDSLDQAGKALDAATDHIKPVKDIKDKVREKLSNNPLTRLKASIRNVKEKVKQAVRKFAREGIQAVGKAALAAAKGIGRAVAANPVLAIIIFIGFLILMSFMDNTETNTIGNQQSDSMLLDNPVYVNVDGMVDDEAVVVLMGDCVDQQYDTMGELDADKEKLAKSIYSVFHSYGLNNASIAGMLGNIDIESGLDPSAIEGIFSEYGFLGTRKAAALLSLTAYTENTLFPMYVNNGKSINRDGYKVIDSDGRTVYYCGIGLVQWTGGNAYTLFQAAETLGIDWYDMDYQLGYMMSDCMYRPNFFSGWVDNQEEGLEEGEEGYEESWIEAARNSGIKFAHDYEGNTSNDDERADASEEWFNIIKDWGDSDVDQDYVDAIADLATQLGGIIEFLDVENAQYRCLSGNVFDNSSIANAAVSFAWPTREQSLNNGTNLYQVVHDGIFPGDLIYKACDRAVAMAIRWSGSDDVFPCGTSEQLRYMSSSSKWDEVGLSTNLSIDDLEPGDIFILNGHTFVFVGESVITAAYMGEATPGSDSVSASLNKRSAACDNSAGGMINGNGGQDWDGRGPYHVFRCVDPDNSNTYSSIGSGVTD